jgi:hypothetical protein
MSSLPKFEAVQFCGGKKSLHEKRVTNASPFPASGPGGERERGVFGFLLILVEYEADVFAPSLTPALSQGERGKS